MALTLVRAPPPSPAVHNWKVTPADFNIQIGDGISEANALYNAEAMQAAWDYCAANGRSFLHVGGPIEVAGELKFNSGFTFERRGASSWLKPRWAPGIYIPWMDNQPKIGGFITNLRGGTVFMTDLVEDVTFVDPWIDGELLLPDLEEVGYAQGGTATTITLAAGASAVDGHYSGKYVHLFSGAGTTTSSGAEYYRVASYVGATRVATMFASTPWLHGPPDATTRYQVGTNTLGIGGGHVNFKLLGGIIKNIPTGVGGGGRAFSCQQGSRGTVVDGLVAENCHNALCQQGWIGNHGNGWPRYDIQDSFSNVIARNCDAAFLALGTTPFSLEPMDAFVGSMATMSVVLTNITAYECGTATQRPMSSSSVDTHMKGGVFVFARGHNISATNLRVYNSIPPVYPADVPERIGYGLSGNTGAVVWFNGRSLDINGLYVEGNYDHLIRAGRARAYADDITNPSNNFKIRFQNVKHRGVLGDVLHMGETLPGNETANTELSLDVKAEVETVTEFCNSRFAGYANTRLDIRTRDEAAGLYKRVTGTAAQLVASGNDFAAYRPGHTRLEEDLRPDYIIGKVYGTWAGATVSAAPGVINRVLFYPFVLVKPVTFDALLLLTLTGGAGSSVKAAIWAHDPVTNRPVGAPLAVNNVGVSTAATSTAIMAVTGLTLNPGIYWAGSKYTGTVPSMLCGALGNTFVSTLVGSTSMAGYGFGLADTYANDMPTIAPGAAFLEITTGGVPLVSVTT